MVLTIKLARKKKNFVMSLNRILANPGVQSCRRHCPSPSPTVTPSKIEAANSKYDGSGRSVLQCGALYLVYAFIFIIFPSKMLDLSPKSH